MTVWFAFAISKVTLAGSEVPYWFVAVTCAVNVPGCSGVPEKTPLSNVIPKGNVPVCVQEVGLPVAVTVPSDNKTP